MNHLTLEQCKKLKELGYPQTAEACHFFYDLHIEPDWHERLTWEGQTIDFVPPYSTACPTLEELIEWLREPFWRMRYEGLDEWEVQGQADDESIVVVTGNSPLEAVYNLAVAVKSNKSE